MQKIFRSSISFEIDVQAIDKNDAQKIIYALVKEIANTISRSENMKQTNLGYLVRETKEIQ